jgi:vacuolar-type H+-ATPase subunit E/Vma4
MEGENVSPEAEAVAEHVDAAAASVIEQAHAVAGDAIDNSADAAAAAAQAAEHASGASQVADEAAAELLRKQGELDWMTRNEMNLQAMRSQLEAMPGMVQSQVEKAIAEFKAAQVAVVTTPPQTQPLDPEPSEGEGGHVEASEASEPPTMRPKAKKREWI